MEISKTFTFEASHILPRHPGKCSRLHGHSWVLTVYVKGEVNPETGFVMDYGDIKEAVKSIVNRLDHRHLGTWTNKLQPDDMSWCVPGLPGDFYPSSENLIIWIASEMTRLLRDMWSKLELNETCTSKCILTREEYETYNIRRKGVEEKVKG
jgi:6-pyruvoyltetrahydropterin/6-carboxytetrahydropterin synthase